MEQGLLALVLHAHLPYIRHPEYADFLEEDWLYEAISETYIPLLFAFESLLRDGVRFHLTMSVTPTLSEMLADPLLQDRYLAHVEKLVDLCEKEIHRTRSHPEMNATAQMYSEHFASARSMFAEHYQKNLLNGFRDLQSAGVLEIITSGATHGFLPLIMRPEAKRAQIEVGRQNYRKHFGREPRGIWLPECAYQPEDDRLLAAAGIQYFFVDAHSIVFGTPRPKFGIYAPVRTPSGVAAFARDVETSEQVWSSETGYPGDPDYREFYRDLGYDAEYDYIKPYLHTDGVRRNIGIKYHRVTGKLDLHMKQPYVPEWASGRTAVHADDFINHRKRQCQSLFALLGRKPLVVSPYDAELFGHWWFEGPQFLSTLIRKICHDQDEIRLVSPAGYLEEFGEIQSQQPSASTWGAEGYNRVWVNPSTDWMYKHLHVAEDRMIELANLHPTAEGIKYRALNQAAREMLLAQASDWAFIITTGTAVQYAVKRFKDHVARFTRLYEDITRDRVDESWLAGIEAKDNLFSELDFRVYRSAP